MKEGRENVIELDRVERNLGGLEIRLVLGPVKRARGSERKEGRRGREKEGEQKRTESKERIEER